MTQIPAPISRLRRWSGLLGYAVFVLVVAYSVNQWQNQEQEERDRRRGVFVQKVCVALEDFRMATNDRNEPLYALVLRAEKADPTVDDDTGRKLTPAEMKKKAETLKAFREAYKPIPPVTNCDDPIN